MCSAPVAGNISLAIFLFLGLILGQVFARKLSGEIVYEVEAYLRNYMQVSSQGEHTGEIFFSTLFLYLRYPLLAFFLGFTPLGLILLPLTCVFFGCCLSFSACCFSAAFGAGGVLFALALFGLRCFITFPCYFLAAVPALGMSWELAAVSFGRGRSAGLSSYGSVLWKRLGIVTAVLLISACVDFWISPWLLDLVEKSIL